MYSGVLHLPSPWVMCYHSMVISEKLRLIVFNIRLRELNINQVPCEQERGVNQLLCDLAHGSSVDPCVNQLTNLIPLLKARWGQEIVP